MTDTRNADLTFGATDYLVWLAPRDTVAPTAFADPTSPWLCLGWVDTNGGTLQLNQNTKDITAAGSLEPIRTLMTSSTKDIKCVFQEAINPLVRALWDNVPVASTEPATGTVTYAMPDKPNDLRYAFVFDTVDGAKKSRLYMPNGMVTARGDEQPQTQDVWNVEMTFTFYRGTGGTPAVTRSIDYGGVDVSGFFPTTP